MFTNVFGNILLFLLEVLLKKSILGAGFNQDAQEIGKQKWYCGPCTLVSLYLY